MSKVDWNTVGKYAVGIGKSVACGLLVASPFIRDVIVSAKRNGVIANYGEAVNAIMESGMWSDDKQEAISVLKRYETNDFYRAVISIVNSNMWSSDKLEAIKGLCEK